MKKQTFIKNVNPVFLNGICHRGLHNEQYTENGLNAFANALRVGMAIELDVHLTKDNKIVVFHDSKMERVTGKEGIIEDLTLEEIKTNYRLLDGEEIPTLSEVFDLIQEQVPIVVELKVYRKNYKELAKYVKEELKVIKNKKNIIIISFDPRALFRFKHEGYMRQLLVTLDPQYKWTYSLRNTVEGVDLEYGFLDQKRVQRYSKKHFVNVWTVENKEVFDKSIVYADTITFQHMDEEYVKEKLANKK